MYHEVQQESSGFGGHNTFSPEHRVSCHWPANPSSQGTFDDGLLDIIVMLFDHPIHLGVIWRDLDMADAIPACEHI